MKTNHLFEIMVKQVPKEIKKEVEENINKIIKKGDNRFLKHEIINNWGKQVLFMEKNGNAVGRIYQYHDNPNITYIEGFHVSENMRNKHLGTELLNAMLDEAKILHANECMLWCFQNSWVFNWYQKFGFKYFCEYIGEKNAVWLKKTFCYEQ